MISDTYLSALKQARKDFMEGTGHPEMIIREEVWIPGGVPGHFISMHRMPAATF